MNYESNETLTQKIFDNQNSGSGEKKDVCGELCRYLPTDKQLRLLRRGSVHTGGEENSSYKYAISSEWWHEFCDFINIEFKRPKEVFNSFVE
mmetsp:Transcript_1518/g.1330  ORF Transcript_1518/g.1330 Transcript_1518/m.1330 type:complete len:92 (-) Transcript_1518:87-362(-)